MSKIKISAVLVEDLVFGYAEHSVTINGAIYDSRDHSITFDVAGADVPKADACEAILTEQRNRAGQRFVTLRFQALK